MTSLYSCALLAGILASPAPAALPRTAHSPTAALSPLPGGGLECGSCHTGGADSPTPGDAPTLATHRGLLCTICHDSHGETGNLHIIREVIQTPNSGPRNVILLSEIGPLSYADGDTVLDGVCEVCHTTTLFHRNDAGGDHSHYAQSRCILCHSHDSGFSFAAVAGIPGVDSRPAQIRLAPSPTRGPVTVWVDVGPGEGIPGGAVYDVRGRRVAALVAGRADAETAVLVWDGRDQDGRPAAPGVYFCRVERSGPPLSRRFLVLR